jgi:type I restriction enzyme M protein
MFEIVADHVFPFLRNMAEADTAHATHMKGARFTIPTPALLAKVVDLLAEIPMEDRDTKGDLYEYMLSKIATAGQNGQFRTPRHIIRMMVKMRDPRPGERICDPAAGTCGFLVNAWQHLLETHTDSRDIIYDEEGYPHGLTGSKLTKEEYEFSQTKALTGFDSDSGMTMLRIGSMNLMLHGIATPNFRYTDTLSKAFTEERAYDVVLANPPFKGAIDAADVNPTLPVKCKKTEILFLHLFLRLLENGGRAAVIVPDGVLFGSSNAHADIRKKIIEENRLDGVVSMPSGVFRPYAGVSTAVLLFTKGGTTEKIWFYDMEHDGYSLDDKRQKVADNDIPDLLDCWNHRRDTKFRQKRDQRLSDLQKQIAPLKKDRLEHHAIIHRLKFEEVVSKVPERARAACEQAEAELSELQSRMTPLQAQINQLTRHFWVTKDQVKANKYDLSVSRYRQIEQDEKFYEEPQVTLSRLLTLENVMASEIRELEGLLK